MATFPSDSPLKVSDALQDRINRATSNSELLDLLHQAQIDQGHLIADPADRDGKDYFSMHAVGPVVPKSVAKTLVIDGVKHIVEGANEAELAANELTLMRKLFAVQPVDEQPRNTRGQFVRAEDAVVDDTPLSSVEADLVERALRAKGVDMEALREFTNAKASEQRTQSWKSAGEQFRESTPAWMGGDENRDILANIISSNPELIDAEDKVGAMRAAFQHGIENNLFVENPETTKLNNIGAAQTYDEIKAAVGYKDVSLASGMWGR